MSDLVDSNTAGEEGTALAQLRFLGHLKEYGIVYAVAYFIAQDLGLIATLASTAGGMC